MHSRRGSVEVAEVDLFLGARRGEQQSCSHDCQQNFFHEMSLLPPGELRLSGTISSSADFVSVPAPCAQSTAL